MHTLRRLQCRLDGALERSAGDPAAAIRRAELQSLSDELQRELARLEQMPWPSGRVFVSRGESRPLERRLLPVLRALRADAAPQPAPALARFPARRIHA